MLPVTISSMFATSFPMKKYPNSHNSPTPYPIIPPLEFQSSGHLETSKAALNLLSGVHFISTKN